MKGVRKNPTATSADSPIQLAARLRSRVRRVGRKVLEVIDRIAEKPDVQSRQLPIQDSDPNNGPSLGSPSLLMLRSRKLASFGARLAIFYFGLAATSFAIVSGQRYYDYYNRSSQPATLLESV